jgi:hypothetical protein
VKRGWKMTMRATKRWEARAKVTGVSRPRVSLSRAPTRLFRWVLTKTGEQHVPRSRFPAPPHSLSRLAIFSWFWVFWLYCALPPPSSPSCLVLFCCIAVLLVVSFVRTFGPTSHILVFALCTSFTHFLTHAHTHAVFSTHFLLRSILPFAITYVDSQLIHTRA